MTFEEFRSLQVGDEVWITDYSEFSIMSIDGLAQKETVVKTDNFCCVEGKMARLTADCTFFTEGEAKEVALNRLADTVRNQFGRRAWED